jgi:hypothetical protein
MSLLEPIATTTSKIQFGQARSAGSVFTTPTEICGNSLIVFDFCHHRHHYSRHWFGIEKA